MRCKQPFGEGELGPFVHSAHRNRKMATTAVTLIQSRAMGFALEFFDLFDFATVRASRTIGPAYTFEVFAGLGFIEEYGVLNV